LNTSLIFAGIIGLLIVVVYLHLRAFTKGNELRTLLKKAQDHIAAGELEEAVKLYESQTLQGLEKSPEIRAKVDYQHGFCYSQLALKQNQTKRLSKAIVLLKNATLIYSRLNKKVEQATAMKELAKACNMMGNVEKRSSFPEQAVRVLNQALEILAQRPNTELYTTIQSDLGFTYLNLYEIRNQPTDLTQAIRFFETVFAYYQSHSSPVKLALTKLNLSFCFKHLAHFEDRDGNLAKAFGLARSALTILNQEQDPVNYARILFHIGRLYLELSETPNSRSHLCLAFRSFKKALRIYQLPEYPQEYGQIHYELAKIYQIFGEHHANHLKLQRALGAVNEALKVFNPDNSRSSYFSVLFAKGALFEKMAELSQTGENLLNASQTYELVLKSVTACSNPEIFTAANYQLGMNRSKLARFGHAEKRLAEAVYFLETALRTARFSTATAHRKAQEILLDVYEQLDAIKASPGNIENLIDAFRIIAGIYSPDEEPEEYSKSQVRLGNALRKLAEFTKDSAHLKHAVTELEKAAEVYGEVHYSKKQAAIFANLGAAFLDLEQMVDSESNLEKAIGWFQKADQIYSKSKQEKDLALVQMDLGTAYYRLGLRRCDAPTLIKSVKFYEAALKVFNQEERSSDFVKVVMGLGLAYGSLVEFNERKYNLIKAAGYLDKALSASPLDPTLDLTRLKEEYAWVLMNLADYGNATNHLHEAIRLFEAVLPHYDETGKATESGTILNHLAVCYQKLTDVSLNDKKDNLIKSIAILENALRKFVPEKYPQDFAMTKNNLGTSYSRLAKITDRDANVTRALLAFEAALKIYTSTAYPEEYRKVRDNIRRLTR
jgi:tetratricopeptide (TPR) repeat protein